MSATRATVLAVSLSLLLACHAGNAEYGGEPERQLAAATIAADVGRVSQLLAAGADPNKMAAHEGHYQSPWKLAIHQVRPGRRDLDEIVRVMLRARANPDVAWGQAPSLRSAQGYTTQRTTPILDAVADSAPDAVRALMEAGLDRRLGQLALVLAVENGQAEIVHVLVEAGVSVNCQPSANTPLVAAIEARNVPLMVYLEEHGARERP
ncbi:MAG: ankyrin repeat domain-containing protein [Acidobacteriota bacterium]